MDITIGNVSYQLIAAERNGEWHAQAVRSDTGDRYGVETRADTEDEATARLTQWLQWQHEHTLALKYPAGRARVSSRPGRGGVCRDAGRSGE